MQKLTARPTAKLKAYSDRQAIPRETHWLTRFVLLRLLGFVYLFAYLSLALQVRALIGHNGILPADLLLQKLQTYGVGFWQTPSIFRLGINDPALVIGAWIGVTLSIVVLFGYPFPSAPPQAIRIELYRYMLNKPWSGKPVWSRKLIGTRLPSVTLKDKAFAAFIHENGWQ